MNLQWQLDEEEGRLKADNLLGYISIGSGDGLIEEHDIYLDSWLVALVNGVKGMEAGKQTAVQIEEELYPLQFEPEGEGFQITYQAATVTIPSTAAFRKLLHSTCREFMQDVFSRLDGPRNEPLMSLYDFAGKPSQSAP